MRSRGALAAMLALTACPSPSAATRSDADARVASTPIPHAVSLAVAGAYIHPGSGMAFPEKAAGFQRTDVSRFDAEGNDVGVHYRAFGADLVALFRAEVTLFVFPAQRRGEDAQRPFDDQFAAEAAEVRGNPAYHDLREVRRTDADLEREGRAVHVRAAEFSYVGGKELAGQQMLTILAAFVDGTWRVTYRADFPPLRRTECLDAVERLVAALGLPPTGLPATTQ